MSALLLWRNFARNPFFHADDEPGTTVRVHRHDFWEIFLVRGGSGTHTLNGRNWPLEAGQLWLIRPDDLHGITPQSRLRFVNIAFPPSLFARWCEVAGLSEQRANWERDDAPKCVGAPELEPLFAALKRQFAAPESARSLELCALWNETARRLLPAPSLLPPGAPFWMGAALEAMGSDAALRQGWPHLLRAARVSPSHLSREWKRVWSLAPTVWINERRLERAATLLLTTDLAIGQIAARCGFESAPYFTRKFRAKFAASPREFRGRRR